jgi:hypothetical protein
VDISLLDTLFWAPVSLGGTTSGGSVLEAAIEVDEGVEIIAEDVVVVEFWVMLK